MKLIKTALLLLAVWVVSISANAQLTQTLTFKAEDFRLVSDDEDLTTIKTNLTDYYTLEDPGPCMPFLNAMIALPYASTVADYQCQTSKSEILAENVILANNPTAILTGMDAPYSTRLSASYSLTSYPDRNCEYLGLSYFEGIPIAMFRITPFIYDAEIGCLSFFSEITLDITLEGKDPDVATTSTRNDTSDLLKSLVLNPGDIDDILAQRPESSTYYPEIMEYFLITTPELASTFKKLEYWKKIKGVSAQIVTTDQISSWYEGSDLQEEIKHCLYDAYLNYGLKYAVLCGDDSLIPARKCYAKVGSTICTDMPCDDFFGCFGGNFEWNANGNNYYGEIDDDIDFTHHVNVSRIPIRTAEQAEAYISKLISYEMGLEGDQWPENIVTAGLQICNREEGTPERSDMDITGDTFYDTYIKNYWDGTRLRFYETGTDFPGDADYDLDIQNVCEQLSEGHMFFSMASHGGFADWMLEKDEYLRPSHIETVSAKGFTIITTATCNSNGFDSELDPCLSESFIRSQDSGVVAYIGSTRESWYYTTPGSVGPCMQFEGTFYQNLFDNKITNKNIGHLLSVAKFSKVPYSKTNSYYRWTQYGLNLMGDAEMPVFTHRPKNFDDLTLILSKGKLKVSTGVDGCKICVTKANEDGTPNDYHLVYDNVSEIDLHGLSASYTIVVTKQDYKPFVYLVENFGTGFLSGPMELASNGEFKISGNTTWSTDTLILDRVLQSHSTMKDCVFNKTTNKIEITLDNAPNNCETFISIFDMTGQKVAERIINTDNLCFDSGNLPSGIYIITAENNNSIRNSKKLLIY